MDFTLMLPSIYVSVPNMLSSMHSHINNSTYMYILPQLTGAPAHCLCTGTPLYIGDGVAVRRLVVSCPLYILFFIFIFLHIFLRISFKTFC